MSPVTDSDGSGAYVPHFRMLLAGLGVDAIEPDSERMPVDAAFLQFFLTEYARLLPFDAAFYAQTYPDVVALIGSADAAGLAEHFAQYGFREGRLPYAVPFDADYYIQRHADLHDAGLEAGVAARAHYQTRGRAEGRSGHASTDLQARGWWQAMHRTPCRLAHRTMTKALVLAFKQDVPDTSHLGFRGGVVLGEGPADQRLRHRRGGVAVDSFPQADEPTRRLAGEYVYGGPYYDHFGHTMAEMIHRILPSRAAFTCRQLLFVGTQTLPGSGGFSDLPPVMQAPLLFLGVDPAEVTVIHDHRCVDVLHVAQQGSDLSAGPTLPYLQMLAAYTPPRLDALHDGDRAAAKLYVSRSRICHGGLLLGERYLEELLRAEGFHIFHPQDHTLVAQMQAYHRAETVVFCEGSACHGAELFGIAGLAHCVLLPRRANHVWLFDNTLRPRSRRFDVLPCATDLGTIVADEVSGLPLAHLGVAVLELEATMGRLHQLGLIERSAFDQQAYRRAARHDLSAYLQFHLADGRHRLPSTRPVDAAARAAFQARCVQALA